jgi:hypothetical protein
VPPAEILLARIDVVVPEADPLALDDITVDNTTRPYLMHTQLIQELFDIPDLAGEGGAAPARELHEWASIIDVSPRGLALWLHIGQDLNLQPNENIRLQRVRPNGSLEQLTIGLSEDVARRNDVGRYYQVRTFVNLENGDFLLFTFAATQIQVGGAGTLSDFIASAPFTYPNYQPGPGALFAFHVVDRGQGGITEERVREIILELATPQEPVVPFVTVTALTEGNQARAYELWFHLDGIAEQNEGLIETLNEGNFVLYVEPEPNVVARVTVEFEQLRPNVWHVFPSFGNQRTRSLLRMAFILDRPMGIRAFNPAAGGIDGFQTLREYIDNTRQRMDGHMMNSEEFGEVLVVYVREQGMAGRLPL